MTEMIHGHVSALMMGWINISSSAGSSFFCQERGSHKSQKLQQQHDEGNLLSGAHDR